MLKSLSLLLIALLTLSAPHAYAQQAERSMADPRYSAAVYIGAKAALAARVEKDCLPLLNRPVRDPSKFFDTWKDRNQRFIAAGRKFLDFRALSASTPTERKEMTTTYVLSVAMLTNQAVEGTAKVYGEAEACRRLEQAIMNKSLDVDGGTRGAPPEVAQLLAWADQEPPAKRK